MSNDNELPQEVEEAIEAELKWLFDMGGAVSEAILSTIRSELELAKGEDLRIKGCDLLYILGYAIVDIASVWAAWRASEEELK